MRQHIYDPVELHAWERYPIRLLANEQSTCCKQPQVLVRSKDRGFVTVNCVECNTRSPLSSHQFRELAGALRVECPKCDERMEADENRDGSKNYGFACNACELFVWLSDLLPSWQERRT